MSRATDPDAALVAALQLAASSKSLYEKRVGALTLLLLVCSHSAPDDGHPLIDTRYLYLAERMSRGHELGLMFINTIRKVSKSCLDDLLDSLITVRK